MGKKVSGVSRRRFLKIACVGVGGAVGSLGLPHVRTSAGAQPVTITYLTFLNPREKGPRQQALLEIINDFEAKNPNIKVNVRVVPWGQIDRQFIIEAAAGNEADVARLFPEWLPKHVEAESILPLDEFVSGWTTEQRKDWVFPWEGTVLGGKKVAFPMTTYSSVLNYRKDMLDKVGVKVPKTWTELAEVSKALTEAKMPGLMLALSKKDGGSNFFRWTVSAMWSMGGSLWDEKGRAAFNTDAGARAFQYVADLVNKYGMPRRSVNISGDDILLGLQSGTIAMSPLGTHRVSTARRGKGIGENLRTAPLPYPDGTRPAAYAEGWLACLGRNTKHKAEAWKFLEHLISVEAQVVNAKVGGEMPSRKSTFKAPLFQTPAMLEMVSWAEYVSTASRPYTLPPKVYELSTILAVAASRIVLDGVPVKRALQEAEVEYNKAAS